VATTTVSPAETPESVNSFGRLFGVLFSPKATFASIARRPTWLVPVLLLSILSVAATFTLGARVGWRAILEQQMQRNPLAQRQMEQLKPEQREQIIQQQLKYVPVIGYAGAAVATAITMVVIAAVFLGIFNLACGTSMRFPVSLGVVAYAWVPWAIYQLLAIVILLFKDPETVDVQNIVASNLAIVLPDGAARWLVVLLSSVDLFSVWTILLLALGYRAADPRKLSLGKALAVVIGTWLFVVLLRVGVAAAFS